MWNDMDLQGIVLSEISQTDRDKYHVISYAESKEQKKWTNKTKTHRYREWTADCQREGGSGALGGKGEGMKEYKFVVTK